MAVLLLDSQFFDGFGSPHIMCEKYSHPTVCSRLSHAIDGAQNGGSVERSSRVSSFPGLFLREEISRAEGCSCTGSSRHSGAFACICLLEGLRWPYWHPW